MKIIKKIKLMCKDIFYNFFVLYRLIYRKKERRKETLKKKRFNKFQKTDIIKDYEKKLNNRPQEESALRDGNTDRKMIAKNKYEENNFIRLNKNKRDKKIQRKIRERNQIGERPDNFVELNNLSLIHI